MKSGDIIPITLALWYYMPDFPLDEEKVLHINADVTAISQLNIQRQLTTKCLDVPFERRNFNFVAAFSRLATEGCDIPSAAAKSCCDISTV